VEYPIVIWPAPVLMERANPFLWDPQDPEANANYLDKLTAVMLAAMLRAHGIGIAAPQIGESVRVVLSVDKEDKDRKLHTLINPEIIENHVEIDSKNEQCLSLPGESFDVVRFKRILVRYQDMDGKSQTMFAEGFFSIELQHEIDHLDGKLLVDQVSQTKRTMIRDRMNLLKKKQKRTGDTWVSLNDLAERLLIAEAAAS
jgi:peptide deformylase